MNDQNVAADGARIPRNARPTSDFLYDILSMAGGSFLRHDFLRELTRRLFELFACARVELFLSEEADDTRIIYATRDVREFSWEFLPLPPGWEEKIVLPLPSMLPPGHPLGEDLDRQLRECLPGFGQSDSASRILWISLSGRSRSTGFLRAVAPRHTFPDDELDLLGVIVGFAVDHRLVNLQLRERVKELTCLYGIAHVAVRPNVTLDALLGEIVHLLPRAWLHPECATARILIDEQEFAIPGWRRGEHLQSADIVVNGLRRGKVEVAYLDRKPDLDEGPFLREERWLIDTIAHELALILQRGQAEDEDKNRLLNQIRHADRLATFGLLAAGVAHEINEPLGNILGFAQLMKKDPELRAQSVRDIDKIVAATLRAREVMQKLMLFARRMPPKKIRVEVNEIVREGLYFLEGRCAQSGIALECRLAPALPPLTADPGQLYQVLVNLVVNAIQAMPAGGRLTIETAQEQERILLRIRDTGTGMDEETVRQIFVPFFTTKNIGEGTGLGLSVAHGIVTAHGGTISVASRPGEGSVFTIVLPGRDGGGIAECAGELHE